jgi:hypothetical protein
MPHKEVAFKPWVQEISAVDQCLGRIVKEAMVARDAAVEAGAATKGASRKCRAVFNSAENTIAAVRDGRIKPGSDAAWKRATDALRKYTSALDCADPRAAGLAGRR